MLAFFRDEASKENTSNCNLINGLKEEKKNLETIIAAKTHEMSKLNNDQHKVCYSACSHTYFTLHPPHPTTHLTLPPTSPRTPPHPTSPHNPPHLTPYLTPHPTSPHNPPHLTPKFPHRIPASTLHPRLIPQAHTSVRRSCDSNAENLFLI